MGVGCVGKNFIPRLHPFPVDDIKAAMMNRMYIDIPSICSYEVTNDWKNNVRLDIDNHTYYVHPVYFTQLFDTCSKYDTEIVLVGQKQWLEAFQENINLPTHCRYIDTDINKDVADLKSGDKLIIIDKSDISIYRYHLRVKPKNGLNKRHVGLIEDYLKTLERLPNA